MNRAWTLTGCKPSGWPCGGGGSDEDAVHRSDFGSVDPVGEGTLNETNRKVDEIIGKLKGASAVVLAAICLPLFADGIGPQTKFGDIPPSTAISDVVGAAESDPTVAVSSDYPTSSFTNVTVKGVGVAQSSVDSGLYALEFGIRPDEVYGNPEFFIKATDRMYGTTREFRLPSGDVGSATLNSSLDVADLSSGRSVTPYPVAFDSQDEDPMNAYKLLLSKLSFDHGASYDFVPGYDYPGGGGLNIDRIGDDTHTLRPDGTIEVRSPANTLLRAAPWTIVRNGVTQDVATVGSPFYADGFWDVTEVSEECADVPPILGGMYQSSIRWITGVTNRWYASRPPIPMRVVSRAKVITEVSVTNAVSNVVECVKDLHYDKTLGVTWRQVVDNGFIHYIAVTNSDVTAR